MSLWFFGNHGYAGDLARFLPNDERVYQTLSSFSTLKGSAFSPLFLQQTLGVSCAIGAEPTNTHHIAIQTLKSDPERLANYRYAAEGFAKSRLVEIEAGDATLDQYFEIVETYPLTSAAKEVLRRFVAYHEDRGQGELATLFASVLVDWSSVEGPLNLSETALVRVLSEKRVPRLLSHLSMERNPFEMALGKEYLSNPSHYYRLMRLLSPGILNRIHSSNLLCHFRMVEVTPLTRVWKLLVEVSSQTAETVFWKGVARQRLLQLISNALSSEKSVEHLNGLEAIRAIILERSQSRLFVPKGSYESFMVALLALFPPLLESDWQSVRSDALGILKSLGTFAWHLAEQVVPLLLDPAEEVRYAATELLLLWHPIPEILLPTLRESLLTETTLYVKAKKLTLFFCYGSGKITKEEFFGFLHSTDTQEMLSAILTLGKKGIPYLEMVFESDNDYDKSIVVSIINESGDAFIELLPLFKSSWLKAGDHTGVFGVFGKKGYETWKELLQAEQNPKKRDSLLESLNSNWAKWEEFFDSLEYAFLRAEFRKSIHSTNRIEHLSMIKLIPKMGGEGAELLEDLVQAFSLRQLTYDDSQFISFFHNSAERYSKSVEDRQAFFLSVEGLFWGLKKYTSRTQAWSSLVKLYADGLLTSLEDVRPVLLRVLFEESERPSPDIPMDQLFQKALAKSESRTLAIILLNCFEEVPLEVQPVLVSFIEKEDQDHFERTYSVMALRFVEEKYKVAALKVIDGENSVGKAWAFNLQKLSNFRKISQNV